MSNIKYKLYKNPITLYHDNSCRCFGEILGSCLKKVKKYRFFDRKGFFRETD